MREDAHIIDIDSIVLHGLDLDDSVQMRRLLGAEIIRALQLSDVGSREVLAGAEKRIVSEIANSVQRTVKAGVRNANAESTVAD